MLAYKLKSKVIVALLLTSSVYTTTAHANPAAQKRPIVSSFLDAVKVSSTPIGWVDFCRRNPNDCGFRSNNERIIKLDEKSWAKIVSLNDKINREIDPVTDQEYYKTVDYWTYPTNSKGDCEDYVLLKRKKLAEMGFPLEALLITIVKDHNDEGHAILTVRTDRGDFILDNQEERVKIWSQTGYKFLKRQSPYNPNDWMMLQAAQS